MLRNDASPNRTPGGNNFRGPGQAVLPTRRALRKGWPRRSLKVLTGKKGSDSLSFPPLLAPALALW
jgi:hypothetical protein